jgi:hypothetical protein
MLGLMKMHAREDFEGLLLRICIARLEVTLHIVTIFERGVTGFCIVRNVEVMKPREIMYVHMVGRKRRPGIQERAFIIYRHLP